MTSREPARPFGPDGSEPALAQHTQVLGDGRLRQVELTLELSDGLL